MSGKRPQSGSKTELTDLRKEIRAVSRNIRKYSRDRTKVAVQSAASKEDVLVDPLPGFEHTLRELTAKYEQINDGAKFRPTDEDRAYDFCEALLAEIGRKDREIRWLTSYYHPQASMTYIEGLIQNQYDSRDKILQSYMVRAYSIIYNNIIANVDVSRCVMKVSKQSTAYLVLQLISIHQKESFALQQSPYRPR